MRLTNRVALFEAGQNLNAELETAEAAATADDVLSAEQAPRPL